MGETSRLTAPVSQLKCYSRGNFSADTLLLLNPHGGFRAIGPIHHIHVEILTLVADKRVLGGYL